METADDLPSIDDIGALSAGMLHNSNRLEGILQIPINYPVLQSLM